MLKSSISRLISPVSALRHIPAQTLTLAAPVLRQFTETVPLHVYFLPPSSRQYCFCLFF